MTYRWHYEPFFFYSICDNTRKTAYLSQIGKICRTQEAAGSVGMNIMDSVTANTSSPATNLAMQIKFFWKFAELTHR